MKKGFYLSGLLALCFTFCSIVAKAAPVVTNPRDTIVCSGQLGLFTVSATGTGPITYKWQVSTDGATWSTLVDNAVYSGTTNDTLLITTDTVLDGYWYRAIAINASGEDTSLHSVLTVNPLPWAGTIFGTAEVCRFFSVTLSDSTAGGVWSSANTSIAVVNASGTVTGVAQGFATIRYSYTNSCGTNVASFTMRVDTVVSPQAISGPMTTCVGSSITLMNVNVLGTGIWSASNTNATVSSAGVVTGVAGGSVTITYDFTNACNSVTSTMGVTVDVPLGAGMITGPTAVCSGSWIHLNESVTGGMWISGSTGVAHVDALGNVTGVSMGTSVISYYLSNACGASIATHTVTVNVPAGPITGGDSVGVGAVRTLGNAAPGGMWSSANTAIAAFGTASSDVTGVAVGTTTVSYTVTNACGTTTATETFYVGVPSFVGPIKGADTVCIGSTIALSDSISGGVWSASNTYASVDPVTGVVTGLSTDTVTFRKDTILYTVTTGFGATTVKKPITVGHRPILTLTGPAIVARGGNYFFRGIPYGGLFFSKNNGTGVFVSFSDSLHLVSYGSYVVLKPGKDTITYRYTNKCGTTDSTFVISLAITDVNAVENMGASLSVFPNPTQGEFTLNLVSAGNEDAEVIITNVVGQKVKTFTMPSNKETQVKLDQPAGLYLISVATPHGRYSTKITIAK